MKRQGWLFFIAMCNETNGGHLQQHGKGLACSSGPKIIIKGFIIATVIRCARAVSYNGLIGAVVSLVPVLIINTLDNLLKYLPLHRGKMYHQFTGRSVRQCGNSASDWHSFQNLNPLSPPCVFVSVSIHRVREGKRGGEKALSSLSSHCFDLWLEKSCPVMASRVDQHGS